MLARTCAFFWLPRRRACACCSNGELDVVHVHNLPDFLVFAGLVPRLAGAKVVLDVHDSVPETFATKFSGCVALWKALCLEERLSALVAHRVICVNHAPAGRAGRARHPDVEDVHLDERSGSSGSSGPAVWPATAAAGHTSISCTTARWPSGSASISSSGRSRICTNRIPGVRLHLWGHGDDLTSLSDGWPRPGSRGSRVRSSPKGFPCRSLPRHLRAMDLGVVGNRRSVGRRSDAAGQAAGVRRHSAFRRSCRG